MAIIAEKIHHGSANEFRLYRGGSFCRDNERKETIKMEKLTGAVASNRFKVNERAMYRSKIKTLLSIVVALVYGQAGIAQTLTLELSGHAGKEAIITGLRGMGTDTLGTVVLDGEGKGVLAFGGRRPAPGVVSLGIKGKKAVRYDFILSPDENPVLVCEGEYVHSENATIRQSEENRKMDSWFALRSRLTEKEQILAQLSALYPAGKRGRWPRALDKESERVKKDLRELDAILAASPLYAARLMQYRIAMETILAQAWTSGDARTAARDYIMEVVDYEVLYGSGLWFGTINSCMEIYAEKGAYYGRFGTDMAGLLQQTARQDIYRALAEAAISMVERLGWWQDKEALVAFLKADGRLHSPGGLLGKVILGPAIGDVVSVIDAQMADGMPFRFDGLPKGKEYGLLVFYDSTCVHCTDLMDGLQPWYIAEGMADRLKVCSMALDDDRDGWEQWHHDRQFAWTDTWISEGVGSKAAQDYHITGTPGMFLVNSKLEIVALPRDFAQLEEFFMKPDGQKKSMDIPEGGK